MTIACPYCAKAIEVPPGEIGRRTVGTCPDCHNRYELFYASKTKPPTAMRMRGHAQSQSAEPTEQQRPAAAAAGAPRAVSPPPQPPHRRQPAAPAQFEQRSEPSHADAPMPPQLESGVRLGGYEIISALGRGGMGIVFSARRFADSRKVALKFLTPALAARPAVVLRFMRDAYAAAQLTHPNLVRFYDIGAAGKLRYFSMEFVKGRSLGDVLKNDGPLSSRLAAAYALQAARGLQFAHDHGLVHRDVKPANLLLTDNGIIKVSDLGLVRSPKKLPRHLAKTTGDPQQQFLGTPAYAAPEQFRAGEVVDARADVYSLGCTLYALLTGHPPFGGRTVAEVIDAHATKQALPPSFVAQAGDDRLSDLVMQMMAKRPEDRPQDMGEVIESLEEYLAVEPRGRNRTRPEEARQLAEAARDFAASPWPKQRVFAMAFVAAVCLGVGLAFALHKPVTLRPILFAGAFAVLIAIIYAMLAGLGERRPFALWLRTLITGTDHLDGLGYRQLIPLIILAGALLMTGYLFIVLGVLAAAIAIGLLLRFFDRQIIAWRETALANAETTLSTVRKRGMDENTLRLTALRSAGAAWRAFGESLFGYDAQTSLLIAIEPAAKRKLLRLRDRLNLFAADRLQARRDARQRRILIAQETLARAQAGIDIPKAKHDGAAAAQEFTRQARIVRDHARQVHRAALGAALANTSADAAPMVAGSVTDPATGAAVPAALEGVRPPAFSLANNPLAIAAAAIAPPPGVPPLPVILSWADENDPFADPSKTLSVKVTVETAEGADEGGNKPRGPKELDYDTGMEGYEKLSFFERRFGSPLDVLIGPVVRMVIAALMLAGFAMWSRANKGGNFSNFLGGPPVEVHPLRVSWLPNTMADAVGQWGAAAGALLLLVTTRAAGRKFAALVLLAALVACLGPALLVGHIAKPGLVSALAAVGLFVLAMLNRDTFE